MSIGTQTRTYTVTDVRRVLASFAADFAMIAQATGLRSRDNVASVVSDLQAFAEAGYLLAAHLILWDASGNKLRAAQYTVSIAAGGWINQQPGNNLWPRTPGGSLQVIGTFSNDWWVMDEATKARVRAARGIAYAWAHTDTDTSHHELTADADRRYVSNGYGLERVTYR